MRQASDPSFSSYDCLFIYFNDTHVNKREAEWPLTAMSNISFCQICLFFLPMLSLDVFIQRWEFSSLKGVEGEPCEWPAQEGSIKSRKREHEQGMDDPEGRGEVEGEGAPLPGPRHLGWQSPSWLQTAFVKEGKRGSLLHLGMGQ